MNYDTTLSTLELFSGTGMLGEGLRAGLRYLGIKTRAICHIEREGYAASVLVARMQEKSMDDAPIFADVCTFNARAWFGKVDFVVAGFPCQDMSLAGKRVGLDGARSGLFFEVVRIATDSGARYMLLENVAGIASATASVVDEAEGALDERAASRVVGELADRGWDSEWITLSASDVGASHGRARWFCLAWRKDVDDAPRHERDGGGNGEAGRRRGVCEAGDSMGNARLQHGDVQQRIARAEHQRASEPVDDAQLPERRASCTGIAGGEQGYDTGGRQAHGGAGIANEILEQPARIGRQERRPKPARQQGRPDVAEHGGAMADTSGATVRRDSGTALGAQEQDGGRPTHDGDGIECVYPELADTDSNGQRASGQRECGASDIAPGIKHLADTSSARLQKRNGGG